MKSFDGRVFVLLCLNFWFMGCASYTDEVKQVELSFRAGQYDEALKKLEETGLKDQARNRLLYMLEKSMIYDRQGQKEVARQLLMKADKVADSLFTTSISSTAASFVYNDAMSEYSGEDYEKVAIHTVLAHSFLEEGKLKEARVEAARINTKLNEINDGYETNKNRYSEDAYARYLAGMIYESLGELDSAIIDYRSSLRIYQGAYSTIFQTSSPEHLIVALYRLLLKRNRIDEAKLLMTQHKLLESKLKVKEPFGEIIVLHEVGAIARKERKDFVLPIGRDIVRFSFPAISQGKKSFDRTGIKIDEGSFEPAEIAQNMDTIARETLEDRRGRILIKSAARLIIKSQMTQKAEKELGPLGWLAGNIYGAITETADTRSWTLLPAAIEVSRLQLKPGTYDVTIYNNGRTSGVKKIKVRAGAIEIVRDY